MPSTCIIVSLFQGVHVPFASFQDFFALVWLDVVGRSMMKPKDPV